MYVDYPRCPECQFPLVKCKRYSYLIKKIQEKVRNVSMRTPGILSNVIRSNFLTGLFSETEYGELPDNIIKIIKNIERLRQYELGKLFLHAVNLFRKLSDEVAIERDIILKAIYEHVEANDSLFLTHQQWLDLENEYNRLMMIDNFRKISTIITVLSR